MSNSRHLFSEGKFFIPRSIDSKSGGETFSIIRLLLLISMLLWLVLGTLLVVFSDKNLFAKLILLVAHIYTDTLIIRLFVINEGQLLKYYRVQKQYQKTTLESFWKVAQLKNTDEGCIIRYINSSYALGVIVAVNKATIVGSPPEFRQKHFYAIAEMYKMAYIENYTVVNINDMLEAGRDDRLSNLENDIFNEPNAGLSQLLKANIEQIKFITQETLTEMEYYLFLTKNFTKEESILSDARKIIQHILSGGYASGRILKNKEIIDLGYVLYGINYFDIDNAISKQFDTDTTRVYIKVVNSNENLTA